MKFNGQFEVSPRREEVFEILADPSKFGPLLPTFHSMEMKDDRTARLKVKVGVGKIRGTATTELALEERDAPVRARYVGKGKVMGGAYNMISAFQLEEAGTGTLVKWQGEVQLFGKILSLAGGGLRGYAQKQIQSLIDSLQLSLSPEGQAQLADRKKAEEESKKWWTGIASKFRRKAKEAVQPEATAGAVAETVLRGPWTTAEIHELETPVAPLSGSPGDNDFSSAVSGMSAGSWVAQALPRKEDGRLVRGRGLFVDDYQVAGMLHLALVRSPYAHARIQNIDVAQAEALPGVVCTLTGKEMAEVSQPFMQIGPGESQNIQDYPMAIDRVRYQGEPVVAVVAESPRIAADAAQLVDIDYEKLDAVVSCEDALADQIILHDGMGTNRNWHGVYEYGDVDQAFADAAHVVKLDTLHFHRFSSTPLETNACVATWSPFAGIEIFTNNSFPAIGLQLMAPALGVGIDQIRCRTHDIGGSYGNKISSYTYMTLAVLASRKTGGRPVKWVELRNENLLAGGHGSERTFYDTEVALDADGVITAISSRHVDDCGAFPRYEPLGCVIWSQVLPATYKVRNIRIDFSQITTNKCPAVPNRGYSRLQHLWFMERVIDICAHELGMPADEIRLRNYIREFPYTTPNGCVYDSGDYPAMLDKAKALIGWDEWQAKRNQARSEGRWLGIGIGTTLDSGTNNFGQSRIVNPHAPFSGNSEVCTIKLDIDGSVVVSLGTVPSGQGHETTTAQVVADELGIRPDMVDVRIGFDTARNSHTGHSGTYASQFAVTGLSAVHGACEKLKSEMRILAAYALEANEQDLEFGLGDQGPEVRVKGTDQGMVYWALANLINSNNAGLPPELAEVTLNVRYVYRPPFEIPDVEKKYGNLTLTYAAQLHIAVIEVNRDTCTAKILAYAAVDDCGRVINPKIVEGQVHGAAAHGIGAALMESYVYDDQGNLLTSSFTDYTPITALNMPSLACGSLQSPSPFSYNGAKGMGEGGGAPLHAVSAALQDALFDQNVIIRDSHNPPNAIFEAVRRADRSTAVSAQRR